MPPWRTGPGMMYGNPVYDGPPMDEEVFQATYNSLGPQDLDFIERIHRGPWGPQEDEMFDRVDEAVDAYGPVMHDFIDRSVEERWRRRAMGQDSPFAGRDPLSQYFGARNPVLIGDFEHDVAWAPQDYETYNDDNWGWDLDGRRWRYHTDYRGP